MVIFSGNIGTVGMPMVKCFTSSANGSTLNAPTACHTSMARDNESNYKVTIFLVWHSQTINSKKKDKMFSVYLFTKGLH